MSVGACTVHVIVGTLVSVQVWASEAEGAVHSPPHDVIWRGQPNWGCGSTAITKLVSKSGEVSLSRCL